MRVVLVLWLLGGWLLPVAAAPVAGEDEAAGAAELQQCRRNLHLIYEAIQAYRRVHHQLPRELSDLRPQFLSDSRYFICPTARRLGLTSADLTQWGASGLTTYEYEFGPGSIPEVMSGGSHHSMREWKQLQLGLVGSEVPIVRCHTHEKVILNLSFGGRIYETAAVDWEPVFGDVLDPLDLSFGRCLSAYMVRKRLVIPRRTPATPPNLIDLAEHYNLSLDELWPGDRAVHPLSGLPIGMSEFAGTPFDVRGAVQLQALQPGLVQYPAQETDIRIGLPARTIHLLVATAHTAPPQTLVAEFVFHLADGSEQRLKLRYGREISRCVPTEPTPPEGAVPATWSGATPEGSMANLYQCQWTNPAPKQIVQSVDFVRRDGNAGPLLLGITVEAAASFE